MLDEVGDALERGAPRTRYPRRAPSAALTTYRCGGPVAILVRVDHERDLVDLSGIVAGNPAVPLLVIGRGSNLLIADGGFDGVGIVLGGDFERIDLDREHHSVDAGGAVPLPVLARQAAKAGIAGLEFYVGIPGSVGGALRMNAGGHGSETADVVVAARVLGLATRGEVREVGTSALGFGYRSSALAPDDVVISAGFVGRADVPSACAAPHRRDRALAARTPARRAERGFGFHESAGRQRRTAHRRVRAEGPAGRRGRGLGEARQLLCGSSRGPGRRRRRPDPPGPATGRVRYGCAARSGSATRRLRRLVGGGIRMTTTTTGTTTGTEEASGTAAPVRIDPRIRERRIEVIREAGRRRLRVLLVVSSVLSAAGLAFLVVTSPVLDVDRVVVTGASHLTNAQVRTASGVHAHDHLLFVDTGAVTRRIEQLPWVSTAKVRREFPGTLAVTVTEYVPAAYVRVPGGVMLIAANGHAIARVAAIPPHTVELRGVRRAPDAGELLAPPDAAGIVGQLPAALAQRVAAVDVSGDGLALDTVGNGEIRLGDVSDLASKSASALAVLGHLGNTHFAYVDVSVPSRPLVALTPAR